MTAPTQQQLPQSARRNPIHFGWPILGVSCLALYFYMICVAGIQDSLQQGSGLAMFWGSYALLWIVLTAFAFHQRLRNFFPANTPPRFIIGLILAIALLTRLTIVFTTNPILSDDIYRYVHDGSVTALGHDPYQFAPNRYPEPATPYTHLINHPDLPTIYLPASQYVFAALWKISPRDYEITVFRLGFVAFDMIIIALLLAILKQRPPPPHSPHSHHSHTTSHEAPQLVALPAPHPPTSPSFPARGEYRAANPSNNNYNHLWFVVLYAWHPLPLIEIASSGHQDTIGIACLLAALLCWNRGQASRHVIRLFATGFFIMLAASIKPVVLPMLIPIAWTLRKNWRDLLMIIVAMLVTCGLVGSNFVLAKHNLHSLMETLRTFAEKWSFNGPIHEYVRQFMPHATATLVLSGLVLFALTAWLIIQSKKHPATNATHDNTETFTATWLVFALIVSSTVHPWYLLWSLALLPLLLSHPTPQFYSPGCISGDSSPILTTFTALTLWLFSLTITIAHAPWQNPTYWDMPHALLVLEFLPVLVLPVALPLLVPRLTHFRRHRA